MGSGSDAQGQGRPVIFEKRYQIVWSDLDPFQHMRNTAYSDYGTNTRFSYFTEQGYPFLRMAEIGVAPILFSESLVFKKEVRLFQQVVYTLRIAGVAPDSSRWRLHHEVFRLDEGEKRVLSAEITVAGAWMDLSARRLAAPPAELAGLFSGLIPTGDFEELSPIRR